MMLLLFTLTTTWMVAWHLILIVKLHQGLDCTRLSIRMTHYILYIWHTIVILFPNNNKNTISSLCYVLPSILTGTQLWIYSIILIYKIELHIFKQTKFLETIVLHNINNIDGNLTDATQINTDWLVTATTMFLRKCL